MIGSRAARHRFPSWWQANVQVVLREGEKIHGGIPAGFVAEEDAVLGDVVERTGGQGAFVSECQRERFDAGHTDRLGKANEQLRRTDAAASVELELAAVRVCDFENREMGI